MVTKGNATSPKDMHHTEYGMTECKSNAVMDKRNDIGNTHRSQRDSKSKNVLAQNKANKNHTTPIPTPPHGVGSVHTSAQNRDNVCVITGHQSPLVKAINTHHNIVNIVVRIKGGIRRLA